jgi:hypothetical protein
VPATSTDLRAALRPATSLPLERAAVERVGCTNSVRLRDLAISSEIVFVHPTGPTVHGADVRQKRRLVDEELLDRALTR